MSFFFSSFIFMSSLLPSCQLTIFNTERQDTRATCFTYAFFYSDIKGKKEGSFFPIAKEVLRSVNIVFTSILRRNQEIDKEQDDPIHSSTKTNLSGECSFLFVNNRFDRHGRSNVPIDSYFRALLASSNILCNTIVFLGSTFFLFPFFVDSSSFLSLPSFSYFLPRLSFSYFTSPLRHILS